MRIEILSDFRFEKVLKKGNFCARFDGVRGHESGPPS
jgi:hypothetical protein